MVGYAKSLAYSANAGPVDVAAQPNVVVMHICVPQAAASVSLCRGSKHAVAILAWSGEYAYFGGLALLSMHTAGKRRAVVLIRQC